MCNHIELSSQDVELCKRVGATGFPQVCMVARKRYQYLHLVRNWCYRNGSKQHLGSCQLSCVHVSAKCATTNASRLTSEVGHSSGHISAAVDGR